MTTDATVGDLAGQQELSCPFGGGPAAAPGSRPRPKRGYFIPGMIALFVCAVIAVVIDLAGLQSHTPHTLAASQVEALVSQRLQATHPQRNPPAVQCPGTEPIRAGVSFRCTLVAAGRSVGVIGVTETTGTGILHVSLPSS